MTAVGRGGVDEERGRGAAAPGAAEDPGDGADPGLVREVAGRAIRRLALFEGLLLAGAAVLSLAAGALVALVVTSLVAVPFGLAWTVASVLLFVVPGLLAFGREWRSGRRSPSPDAASGGSGEPDGSRPDGERTSDG